MKSQEEKVLTTTAKAPFWKRFIAFLIDHLLLSVFSAIIGLMFGLSDAIEYWFYVGLFYTYNIFMDYTYQATLGKKIIKVKVISIDGQKPDLKNSFYRNFGKIVSALPLFYGFLRILNPQQQQTIHDELGKCLVIETLK